jgi:hypothetical protein
MEINNAKEDVYLCICTINCVNISCNYKHFNSFLEADKYYQKKYNNYNKHISTMISTKYIPQMFKKYYLNYKLSKLLLKFDEK